MWRVLTDNGSLYLSWAFAITCARGRVHHRRTRPYTPRINRKAQCFIQSMLQECAYPRPFFSSAVRRESLAAPGRSTITTAASTRPSTRRPAPGHAPEREQRHDSPHLASEAESWVPRGTVHGSPARPSAPSRNGPVNMAGTFAVHRSRTTTANYTVGAVPVRIPTVLDAITKERSREQLVRWRLRRSSNSRAGVDLTSKPWWSLAAVVSSSQHRKTTGSVAHLDRAPAFEAGGSRFESCRSRFAKRAKCRGSSRRDCGSVVHGDDAGLDFPRSGTI